MVRRNQIHWADLPAPAGRRPVCVLTRDAALSVLHTVTCAPITRTIRGIRSEVPVGPAEGLPRPSMINCDTVLTVPMSYLDPEPVGVLDVEGKIALDRALRFSLDIVY